MAVFGFLLLMAIVLPINAWLLKAAVKIVREQITYRDALIVSLVNLLISGFFGMLELGSLVALIGWVVGWVVFVEMLKKFSSINELWPTAVMVAVFFTLFLKLSTIWFWILVDKMG